MKKKHIIIFILLVVNVFAIINILSSSPSQGLGGIGYGILIFYTIVSFFVLVLVLFFISPNLKVFLKYVLYLLGTSVLMIITLSLFNFYTNYQYDKSIKLRENHDEKVENYFLKVKNKIHKKEDVTKLIKEWNEEISLTSLSDTGDLLTIYFLLSFYDIKKETLLKENINRLHNIPKLNPPYVTEVHIKLIKKESQYNISLSFEKAFNEIKLLDRVELHKNSCFIYLKYRIKGKYNKSLMNCQ